MRTNLNLVSNDAKSVRAYRDVGQTLRQTFPSTLERKTGFGGKKAKMLGLAERPLGTREARSLGLRRWLRVHKDDQVEHSDAVITCGDQWIFIAHQAPKGRQPWEMLTHGSPETGSWAEHIDSMVGTPIV